jgi:hypothetical protein
MGLESGYSYEETNLRQPAAAAVDRYKWISEFLPEKIYGDKKWLKPEADAVAWSEKLESKAEGVLAQRHNDLLISNGQQNVRVFPFKPALTLEKDRTALQLAEEQLGTQTSRKQIEHYARTLLDLNGRKAEPAGSVFKAKTIIKIPGQTADGGLTSLNGSDDRTTVWQDGSILVQKAAGGAEASWPDRSDTVTLSWNNKSPDGNHERRTSQKDERTDNPDGSWYRQTRKDEKSAWIMSERVEVDRQGLRKHFFLLPSNQEATKISIEKPGAKTFEFQKNAQAEFLSADGSSGVTPTGIVYKIERHADGSQERLHENGTRESIDAKGNLLARSGCDQQNRLFQESYRAGEKYPYKVDVTLNHGEPPTGFLRTPGGRYVAAYLLGGRNAGEIELRPGLFEYKDRAAQTVLDKNFDGKWDETFNLPYQNARTIEVDGDRKLITEKDRAGTKKSKTWVKGKDLSISKSYNSSGDLDGIIVSSRFGNAELKKDRERDQVMGSITGKGHEAETFYVSHSKLIYPPDLNNGLRSKVIVLPDNLDELASLVVREFNQDLRTVTTMRNGHKQVEDFESGRTDIMEPDGTVRGIAANGEKSTIKPSGEVMVEHSDSAVRLNSDGTVDRWGGSPDESARREPLSPGEKSFLDRHRGSIDLRDLAEIHGRFKGESRRLDGFYAALSKVEDIPAFSAAEKQALIQNIIHHVADPADINQGAIGTCVIAVVQRELAVSDPERYIGFIVDAASNKLRDASTGARIKLDPANLKMHDFSNRDLASRVFQTAALNLVYFPGNYVNTLDTNAEVHDRGGNLRDYSGLIMPVVAELAYKVTGKEHSMVKINSAEDLAAAFEANQRRPMIAFVNASTPPFATSDNGFSGHVVTVSGIDKGPPLKVFVQNQWGLKNDHSTPESAVDGALLVRNMQRNSLVLVLGPQQKVLKIDKGKFVVDEDATRDQLGKYERSAT